MDTTASNSACIHQQKWSPGQVPLVLTLKWSRFPENEM